MNSSQILHLLLKDYNNQSGGSARPKAVMGVVFGAPSEQALAWVSPHEGRGMERGNRSGGSPLASLSRKGVM